MILKVLVLNSALLEYTESNLPPHSGIPRWTKQCWTRGGCNWGGGVWYKSIDSVLSSAGYSGFCCCCSIIRLPCQPKRVNSIPLKKASVNLDAGFLFAQTLDCQNLIHFKQKSLYLTDGHFSLMNLRKASKSPNLKLFLSRSIPTIVPIFKINKFCVS